MAYSYVKSLIGGIAQATYQNPADSALMPQTILVDVNGNALLTAGAAADAVANPTIPSLITFGMSYNGSTWDRWINNQQGTLLALAARTAAPTASVFANMNARGIHLFIHVTAASGTGGLTPVFYSIDPVSGTAVSQLSNNLGSPITAAGSYEYEFYPGATGTVAGGTAGIIQRLAGTLPRSFSFLMSVGDSSSYTYSVGYSLVI